MHVFNDIFPVIDLPKPGGVQKNQHVSVPAESGDVFPVRVGEIGAVQKDVDLGRRNVWQIR